MLLSDPEMLQCHIERVGEIGQCPGRLGEPLRVLAHPRPKTAVGGPAFESRCQPVGVTVSCTLHSPSQSTGPHSPARQTRHPTKSQPGSGSDLRGCLPRTAPVAALGASLGPLSWRSVHGAVPVAPPAWESSAPAVPAVVPGRPACAAPSLTRCAVAPLAVSRDRPLRARRRERTAAPAAAEFRTLEPVRRSGRTR
jgi:hypothetical protein